MRLAQHRRTWDFAPAEFSGAIVIRILAIFAAVGVVMTAGAAGAAPMCQAGGTLADYIGLGAGGCVLGDKVFSNFSLALGPNAGTTTVPTAAQIMVTPLNEPFNPGFTFTGKPPFASPAMAAPFFFSWR